MTNWWHKAGGDQRLGGRVIEGLRRMGGTFRGRASDRSTTAALSLPYRVVIGTHHKAGTVWLRSIFSEVCRKKALHFHVGDQDHLTAQHDVFFQPHSRIDPNQLAQMGPYRGLHMIRDPRDRIISGCFYHQQALEEWLHVRRPEFGGLSYQQKLNSHASMADKLIFEMENSAWAGLQEMSSWDYANPNFLEIKYEDLVQDQNLLLFHEVFAFLGFPEEVLPDALQTAYNNSLFSGRLEKSSHIRSGAPDQWKRYFMPHHRTRFLELFGDILIRLGYERDNEWATA